MNSKRAKSIVNIKLGGPSKVLVKDKSVTQVTGKKHSRKRRVFKEEGPDSQSLCSEESRERESLRREHEGLSSQLEDTRSYKTIARARRQPVTSESRGDPRSPATAWTAAPDFETHCLKMASSLREKGVPCERLNVNDIKTRSLLREMFNSRTAFENQRREMLSELRENEQRISELQSRQRREDLRRSVQRSSLRRRVFSREFFETASRNRALIIEIKKLINKKF